MAVQKPMWEAASEGSRVLRPPITFTGTLVVDRGWLARQGKMTERRVGTMHFTPRDFRWRTWCAAT